MWIAKALTKKALSFLPFGAEIDYLMQRHVVHSLPCSEKDFRWLSNKAIRATETIASMLTVPLDRAIFVEFGAGWDLIAPLSRAVLGVHRQILIDKFPKLRSSLVNNSLRRFCTLRNSNGLLPAAINDAADLAAIGIRYCVGDLQNLKIKCDVVTSNSTLEHIPAGDLPRLYRACFDLLVPGGMIHSSINCADHYLPDDPLHFLRYSPAVWSLLNSPLHFQNRLRPSDHLRMIEAAGFTIAKYEIKRADRAPSKIDKTFAHYSAEEILGIRLRVFAVRTH